MHNSHPAIELCRMHNKPRIVPPGVRADGLRSFERGQLCATDAASSWLSRRGCYIQCTAFCRTNKGPMHHAQSLRTTRRIESCTQTGMALGTLLVLCATPPKKERTPPPRARAEMRIGLLRGLPVLQWRPRQALHNRRGIESAGMAARSNKMSRV